jgi:hypothetical protein
VTSLRPGRLRNLYSIPGRTGSSISPPKGPDRLWCPPRLLFNGVRGRETDHTHFHRVPNFRMTSIQCRRDGWGGGGSWYKLPAVRKGGRGPTVLHMYLYISVVSLFVDYKLTLSDQAQVTLQLRVSLCDLV